jgi:hypothetical protein
LRKVKDAVDKARGDANFPTDLPAEPNVFEMNFSELMPVMNINLSGDYPMEQLHEYAKHLEDRIEDLTEINKVEIRGVPEREVKVSVDLYQLEALQLNFDDIANALRSENLTMSGGDILTGDQRRSVRVIGEIKEMEQIRNIVVKNEGQREVRLRDIADVTFGFKEPESFAREYGKSVVMLDVIKRAGENLLDASDKINAIIKEDHGTVLPADLTIPHRRPERSDARERGRVDEPHRARCDPGGRRADALPRPAQRAVRGLGDPHEHVHLLHLAQRVRCYAEHDGALRADPCARSLGGRRHRDRGEHPPPHDQWRTRHEGHPSRGR